MADDSDFEYEDLQEEMMDAIQQDTQLENEEEVIGENDIRRTRDYVATVKGVSVQAIVESKILHAIGEDEGLLQRLKNKHNILYLNPAMLQEAYEVISGKQSFSLKRYETREIQADFIRYYKLLTKYK